MPGRTGQERALELSVYFLAGDECAGRPLHETLLDRALAAGLSGATVSLGMQGFGASGQWHRSGLRGPRASAPVRFQVIGGEAAVRAFLPVIDQLVESGLVTLTPTVIIRMTASTAAGDIGPAR
jgi:uncharacterized protein